MAEEIVAKKAKAERLSSKGTESQDGIIVPGHSKFHGKLKREQFLQIRINLLEIESLKKDLVNINLQVENIDRLKVILSSKLSEMKFKISNLEKEHQNYLNVIQKDIGVDIRNKTINPETLDIFE